MGASEITPLAHVRLRLFAFTVALMVPAPIGAAGAPGSAPAGDGQAMQLLADAVVIDAQCNSANTVFGAVFRYGEAHGIRLTDVMLLGKRRGEFLRAYDNRVASTPREEICGSLLARYQQAFPDWFVSR